MDGLRRKRRCVRHEPDRRGARIHEKNLCYASRRPSCGGPVRGAGVCRAGGRARFRACHNHGLRPDPPAALGHHSGGAGAGRRGEWRAGSGPAGQSLRHSLRAPRNDRGAGGGFNGCGQRRTESGDCQRWSRQRQRSGGRGSGVRAGADRRGTGRAGSSPPPHWLSTGATDVSCASVTSNPAASFEPHRQRLLGLAYRMLGSMTDAEDAVQEAYLRWHGTDRDKVLDPRAFLMTTATRICLDMLTSARARREEYVGPWLPEPVVDTSALAADSRTELAEDLSIALLLTLERLSPLERAAFLLHEVFDFSFSEVAAALDRSEAACRQLAARARAHVRAVRPRGTAPNPAHSREVDAQHRQLLSAFVAAAHSGDLHALTQLLASDVRVVTDGGGKAAASLNVLDGADRAARFLVGATRKGWRPDFTLRFAHINGLPGVIVDGSEDPLQTAAFEIEDGAIRALYVVRNPDKLRHLQARES